MSLSNRHEGDGQSGVVPFRGTDRATQLSDALEQDRRLGNWRKPVLIGIVVVLAAFGGLGFWAATAPLDSAVSASGTIAVESNRKLVEHVDGGSVVEVTVEEGDYVERGQLLMRLDAEEAQATFDAVRGQLDGALARRARLVAERDGVDEIDFPQTLVERSDTPRVAQLLAAERRQFRERRQSVEGQTAIQQQRIAQLETRISGLQAQRQSVIRQVEIMRDELSGLRQLMEKGYYPRIRVLERERELARLEGREGQLIADISQARESIGESEMRISQIRQSFREEVVANLSDVDNRIDELKQRLVQARARLDRKNVLAQHAGVVHALQVTSAGAVVKPGGQIMQIIPENDELVVEARVRPQDIELVTQGMAAEVRMTALATATTPVLKGEVVRVSPDRLTDEQSGRSYFSARIVIPPEELKKLGDQRLKAGMPAEVLVQTGERTLVDYLWKPVSDAMSRGLIEP
jgi:HlyD family secretion protein/epimerase transport system membrane fusion protein